MNTKNFKQKMLLWGTGIGSSVVVLGTAIACKADDLADVSASSSAAIKASRDTTLGLFYQNLPTIMLGVIAVTIVLWGINKILSKFHHK